MEALTPTYNQLITPRNPITTPSFPGYVLTPWFVIGTPLPQLTIVISSYITVVLVLHIQTDEAFPR